VKVRKLSFFPFPFPLSLRLNDPPTHQGKTPEERGHILETTFSSIHAESAAAGQSYLHPDAAIEAEGHFTCFVQAPEAEFRRRGGSGAAAGVGDEHEDDEGDEGTGASSAQDGAGAGTGTGKTAAMGGSGSSTTTSTGMRLVELNGSRTGPIDRGECVDLLRVRVVFRYFASLVFTYHLCA
jgi:ubiquitin carboxyl-terminal hydrolase L3